jgi:hypothetical protein
MYMKSTTQTGGNMTTTTLIESLKSEGIISVEREKSPTMWWLADHSQRFLSFQADTVTLWKSNRPYFVNEQIESLPMEQATVETIAALIA